MPRIKEYTSQQSAAGPVNINVNANQFGEQAYQGLSQLGSGIQDTSSFLEKRETQSEVSDLHAKLSDARAKFTQGLADTLKTADPGDHTVVDKFMAGYDKASGDLAQTINTPGARNFFDRANESLRTNLLEHAISGQTELAGIKNAADNTTALNNFSSSIINAPSQYDSAKQQFEQGVDAQVGTGGISKGTAIQYKEHGNTELAKSAVMGWVDQGAVGPSYAKDMLDSGKFDSFINGPLKQELYGKIQAKESFNRSDQARAKALDQDALTQAQENVKQQMYPKIFDGSLSLKDVWNDKTLSADQKLQIQKLTDTQTREGKHLVTDPATFNDFFTRIHNLETDSTKPPVTDKDLENAVISGKLSMDGPESLNSLRKEMAGTNTPEGKALQASKNAVNFAVKNNLGFDNEHHIFKDPQGPENFAKWVTFANNKETDQRAKGKPVGDLYNSLSPDYILPAWRQFSNNTSQIMKQMTGGTGGNASDNRNPQGADASQGWWNTPSAPKAIDYRAGSFSQADLDNIKAGKPLGPGTAPHVYDFSDLSKSLGSGSGRIDQIKRLYSGADEKGKASFVEELKSLGYKGSMPGDQRVVPPQQQPSAEAFHKTNESMEDFLKRKGVK